MIRLRAMAAWCLAALVGLSPAAARAQPAPADQAGPDSRLWITAGGGATTLLGDCSECEEPRKYFHSGSVLTNIGVSLNRRTDLGAELMWVPATTALGDRIHVTFVLAVVQFRPWHTRGFFLKGGAGMAFVRNWVATIDAEAAAFLTKAFGLGLGAGWEWRPHERIGLQLFGAHHVAALGDLSTSTQPIENVMGNYWSAGAAVVIR